MADLEASGKKAELRMVWSLELLEMREQKFALT